MRRSRPDLDHVPPGDMTWGVGWCEPLMSVLDPRMEAMERVERRMRDFSDCCVWVECDGTRMSCRTKTTTDLPQDFLLEEELSRGLEIDWINFDEEPGESGDNLDIIEIREFLIERIGEGKLADLKRKLEDIFGELGGPPWED